MKFDNFKRSLQHHWYALFVAIIVAMIAGLPQLILKNALGSDNHGIPMLVNDSEGEYLSRAQEILDGHWGVASPMLYEYKDSVSLMPPTGEFIFYALPAMLTGLPLSSIVVVSKFIYPALLFILAYLFSYALINQKDAGAKLTAIAGALLIVLGYDAYDYRNLIRVALHGAQDPSGLLWNRLVNPITGAVLLFGYLWLLVRNVTEQSKWLAICMSGFILGAMSGYIFSFALGLTVTFLLVGYFAWSRNWILTRRLVVPVMIAIAMNASYFIGVYLAMSGATPLGDPEKAGMLYTHTPLINLVSLASLLGIVFLYLLFNRKSNSTEPEKRWWVFLLATALACEVVYNQQIITGRTVWPQHFVQYTTPLSMAMLAIVLHNVVREKFRNVWRVALGIIFFVAAIFGVRGFLDATHYTLPKYTKLQTYAGVFNFLKSNAPKDCVVYVTPAYPYPSEINRFIPALTQCNNYHTFYIYSGVPSERIMHNYLLNLRLREIKIEDVKGYFFAPENYFYTQSYFYRNWLDMLCCDAWMSKFGNQNESDVWFAAVEKDVEKRYAQFLKEDLYDQLTRYRLDYLVVDTKTQSRVNAVRYKYLKLENKFGPYAIYSLQQL